MSKNNGTAVLERPLARTTDPNQSHTAASRMKRRRDAVFAEVLHIIHDLGPLTGVELNGIYATKHDRLDDPLHVAYESPRKRAAELVDRGLLHRMGEGDSAGHSDVYVYVLTIDGLEAVA